ncbi:MAG TPA: methyltransferase [Thermoanaerobaculia bacterium]|nr:methyltransferase [Thermoanaerobaculia bacterium]
MSEERFHGWMRPGPRPPGGIEPGEGETLDAISGHYRLFQAAGGHRFSTDDVLVAWYGTQWAPRVERAADLGSGIGSVAIVAAWRLPGARFRTIEAQETSVALARRSVAFNGLDDRVEVVHGDLRDETILAGAGPFDLVLGSPPYRPPGTVTEARHPQARPARIELRGSIADYAGAAARILAPGGLFAFVFPWNDRARAVEALRREGLALLRCRGVAFREGEEPAIGLFAAVREADVPRSFLRRMPLVEPALVTRMADGSFSPEYGAVRMSFGFPPGHEPRE